jgi:8-oxo-dGTP diphosphatase
MPSVTVPLTYRFLYNSIIFSSSFLDKYIQEYARGRNSSFFILSGYRGTGVFINLARTLGVNQLPLYTIYVKSFAVRFDFCSLKDTTHFLKVMRTNTPVLVECAIIEKDGRIFAAQRGSGQSHAGSWEFPGGKVGKGETPEAAIVGEIMEELGAEITVKARLEEVTFEYTDKIVALIPFVCRAGRNEFFAKKHQEIRWLDEESAKGLEWLPLDREIFWGYLK